MYTNIVFVFLVFFTLSFGLTSSDRYSRGSVFLLGIIALLLCSFFIGFRSIDSGTDTKEYYYYFQYINDFPSRFEFGFEIITHIIKNFFDYQVYFFLICFLTLFLLVVSCHINNVNCLLFLGVSLSFLPGLDLITNGIRNGLSISLGIFILSLSMYKSRRILIAVLLSPISAAIHISALVFTILLPMASFISNARFRVKSIYFISICLFIFFNLMGMDFIREIVFPYRSQIGFVGKVSRYILLDDELLSSNVKFYFYVVSAYLMWFTVAHIERINNEIIILLTKVSLLGFLAFSMLYFSAYSFRFMLLFFFLQVMTCSYIITQNLCRPRTKILFVLFVFINMVLTYISKTYVNMTLLELF
ncbi:EpsG family protein [Aeromonas veronii]